MDNWADEQWLTQIRPAVARLLRMMGASDVSLTIVPVVGGADPKLLLEIGAAIWCDTPIVAVVFSGRAVPPGLRRVAHAVIEEADPESPEGRARVAEALRAIVVELARDGDTR
jgi:hypothetical protein